MITRLPDNLRADQPAVSWWSLHSVRYHYNGGPAIVLPRRAHSSYSRHFLMRLTVHTESVGKHARPPALIPTPS